MKLKKLLEGFAWERKPGAPLPTMKDVARQHKVNEAEVFGGGDESGTSAGDQERDVQKLAKKLEGPLEPVINLINTKVELTQVIELILSKVEQNKPGLGKKSKILLKKAIQNL